MRSVLHSRFFLSLRFTSLHFLVMSCSQNLAFASCLSINASVLVCLPAPHQLQLGTNVLSRCSTSILLLALCTACAIRVTVRLMGFTRIRFCVRVVFKLVTSLAIDTSPDSTLWAVLGTWSLDTPVARDGVAKLCYRRPFQFAGPVGAVSHRVTATETIWSMCCGVGNSTVFLHN